MIPTKYELGMDGKKIWGVFPKMSKKRSLEFLDIGGLQYDHIRDGEIGVYWMRDTHVVALFDKGGRTLYVGVPQ